MTYPGQTDSVPRLIEAGLDREAARRGAIELGHRATLAGHSEGETMDTLTQFGHVGGLLAGVVGGITPDQLDRPTPCSEFTVRGVLEHMIGGATAFAAAYRGETPTEPDMSDVLAGFGPALQNLGAAVSAPGALEKTIAAPFGDLDGDTFARFIVLDGLVHGWDLATATGQAYNPPDELVAAAEDFARQTIEPLRDGRTFAQAVEPAPDATPIERLTAYTGRRPLADAHASG
jgi:uncharacterized protein (TIGR03086 family)